jgi:hypothetical protein
VRSDDLRDSKAASQAEREQLPGSFCYSNDKTAHLKERDAFVAQYKEWVARPIFSTTITANAALARAAGINLWGSNLNKPKRHSQPLPAATQVTVIKDGPRVKLPAKVQPSPLSRPAPPSTQQRPLKVSGAQLFVKRDVKKEERIKLSDKFIALIIDKVTKKLAASEPAEVKDIGGKVKLYDPRTTKKGVKSLKKLKEKTTDKKKSIAYLNKLKI